VIGNDIKITLVRVRGNSVRIGIEAPRDVRVVRGELLVHDNVEEHISRLSSVAHNQDEPTCEELQLSEREHAFAHPSLAPRANQTKLPPQIFVGRVRRDGGSAELRRAPLARFMSAH
jgi:carbon storage regulator CsrA